MKRTSSPTVMAPRVEQGDAVLEALPGELATRDADFGAVELVVAGDVEDFVGARPASRDVTAPCGACTTGAKSPAQDNELGVGGEWGDRVAPETRSGGRRGFGFA